MNTTPDGLIAPELSHAFMGFSIYEDVLLPVYDLGRCLEKFAAEGLDEAEAVNLLSTMDWSKRFGVVKPVFWLGNPEVETATVH